MTRLYFLSSLAADLTSIEVLVCLGEAETFIGIVNPRIVKERLAQCYPIIKRYEEALDRSGPPRADLPNEVDRRVDRFLIGRSQVRFLLLHKRQELVVVL
jgi:hypothetical protein